jgi:hypothetical protein
MENNSQIELCKIYEAEFLESPQHLKVGISLNVRDGVMPINGLRHIPEDGTTGWYIWAGEVFSEEPDFFVSLHISHLKEWCPFVLKYLGLAPGWRFLATVDGYEDVWRDERLIG